MKKLFLIGLIILAFGLANSFAANTITETGNVITITDIDSDWLWTANFSEFTAKGVPVISIQFIPGDTDDQCVILNGTAAASEVFNVVAEDAYDQRIQYYFGNPLKLFLDFSAGTYSAGSKVIINVGRVNTIR